MQQRWYESQQWTAATQWIAGNAESAIRMHHGFSLATAAQQVMVTQHALKRQDASWLQLGNCSKGVHSSSMQQLTCRVGKVWSTAAL